MIKKLLTILAFFIIPTLGYAALVPTGWIRNTTTSKFYIPYLGDNVGIGTTSPYAKLSVVGPVVAEYFHATSTTATSTIAGYLSTTAFANTAMTAGSIPFFGAGGFMQQSNANLYYDATNNRLGLGTTSPYAKLSVVGET